MVPSKTKAFAGEQVTAEWFLYLAERQNNYAPTKEPRTDGFWVEDLDVPNQRGGLALSSKSSKAACSWSRRFCAKLCSASKPGRYTITPLEATSRAWISSAPPFTAST